ncbi:(2Fe-2S)-binding protein [Bradyrhizobium ontarionense]|uniref:Bacterioferritin-associated ferredoxin n=1 Tax=Bradyrhizobium ontarionense TaxID=2898149 RepID=A0ABY3RB46_9BRAD|nr:(2Fe-2S)-binding protein [Bradyrhizobium sp. A19]UFZ04169.1 (2Fe-2S)-binding protein [Bradyrhizobium sp. A19]
MIICSCNVISDTAIRDIVTTADITFGSPAQVYDCLGCAVQCGLCSRSVKRILDERQGDTAAASIWPVQVEPAPCEQMSFA